MVGRPKKYFTEEERIKAYHQSKNKYMETNNGCVPIVETGITH